MNKKFKKIVVILVLTVVFLSTYTKLSFAESINNKRVSIDCMTIDPGSENSGN